MAPTHIEDVVINLAASNLRKLKELKAVDCADLIVTGKQMAVSALNHVLVAVEERISGVVEMRVGERARHGEGGARVNRLNRIENRRVGKPGNISDRTLRAVAEAGQTAADTGVDDTQPWVATIAALEGTVGPVDEEVAQRGLASPPAGDGLEASRVHLLRFMLPFMRTAVECPTPEILEKEIALWPELLEVESSEDVGDRLQAARAELVGPVGVRRFADLQSGRDEAAAGGAQFERGFVQTGDGRILRAQHRRVLAEGRRRRGGGLRGRTILGDHADAHAEKQQRQPDCSRSCHAFHA